MLVIIGSMHSVMGRTTFNIGIMVNHQWPALKDCIDWPSVAVTMKH